MSVLRTVMVFLVLVVAASSASASLVNVPGTSDPWLAGMPDGSGASLVDTAPAQSPVLVSGVPLVSGLTVQFSASGGVANGPAYGLAPPDGYSPGWFYPHGAGAENGISDVVAPLNSLVGLFLDDSQPDLSAAPPRLEFLPGGNVSGGKDYLTLMPALKQVFFIGDGLTSGGVQQGVIVPTGATRLFLGTMDGYEWSNNRGSFDVEVTAIPEPATVSLLALGMVAAGIAWRRRTF